MRAEEALPSRGFYLAWIAHELAQYGAEEEAVYLAADGDPARILVATDLGVLELTAQRHGSYARSEYESMRGRLHPWRDLTDMTLETETEGPSQDALRGHTDFWTRLHLVVPALDLDAKGPGMKELPGLDDFARVCARHVGEFHR